MKNVLAGIKNSVWTAISEFWMALHNTAPPLPPLLPDGSPRAEDLSYPR